MDIILTLMAWGFGLGAGYVAFLAGLGLASAFAKTITSLLPRARTAAEPPPAKEAKPSNVRPFTPPGGAA